MEGLYNYGNDEDDRKVVPRDGNDEPGNISTAPVVERRHRSRRGCRPRSRRRRSHRRRKCICKPRRRSRRRRSRRRRRILSNNPFLIFYLEMYFKSPGQHVTRVARKAGKKWCALPDSAKEKYIRLAKRMQRRCICKKRR